MNFELYNISVYEVVQELSLFGYFYDIERCGKNIMVTCPFHKDGNESKPSFGIHEESLKCHCFTCGWKGKLPKLVSELLNTDGEQWLIQTFIYGQETYRSKIDFTTTREPVWVSIDPKVIELSTQNNRRSLEYLATRDIFGVQKIFPIGYNRTRDTIMFFIRRVDGSIAYIKERTITGKQFYNSKNANKKENLFGVYELAKSRSKECWVVESEIDALTLWSWGIPAVAFGGALASTTQLELLQQVGVRRIYDGLDRDIAGREGFKFLQANSPIQVIETKWGINKKDINNLTKEEFIKKVSKIYLTTRR